MKKITIGLKKLNLYFYVATAVLSIISFFYMGLFLYKNFYLAITQSEIIFILRGQVAAETINVDKFDAVINRIEKKETPKEIEISRDVFSENKKNNEVAIKIDEQI